MRAVASITKTGEEFNPVSVAAELCRFEGWNRPADRETRAVAELSHPPRRLDDEPTCFGRQDG